MGMVGGMLGLNGGAGGTGFNSPQGASQGQADQTYDKSINALNQQQGFVNGLVMQANPALMYQQGALQGFANLANGIGPNPAQAQLAQATGQNIANQAALMAGQRGANANVGLMARQAAQVGANAQQQSIGQAANLQAQQQVQGLQGMAGQANQLVGQAAQGLSNQVSGTQGLNANVLNSLSGQNSANASMANTRMGQQGNMIGNIMGGIGSAFNLAEGGTVPSKPKYAEGAVVAGSGQYADPSTDPNNPFNQQIVAPLTPAAPIAPVAPIVPASAQPAAAAKGPRSTIGKFMSGMNQPQQQMDGASVAGQTIGKAIGTGLKNIFGSSAPVAKNGYEQYSASGFSPEQMSTEHSRMEAINAGGLPAPDATDNVYGQANKSEEMPASNPDNVPMAAQGGKVDALVSPGEGYLDRKAVKEVAKGKDPIKAAEKIPGKPKIGGAVNSYANDTVPKKLESGGIVLPRSVMEAKHPHWEAHKFVSAIMAKQGKLPKKSK